jgi:hypothetical protein
MFNPDEKMKEWSALSTLTQTTVKGLYVGGKTNSSRSAATTQSREKFVQAIRPVFEI